MTKETKPTETGFLDTAQRLTDEQMEKVTGGMAPPLPKDFMLTWTCEKCQLLNPDEDSFCVGCGAPRP